MYQIFWKCKVVSHPWYYSYLAESVMPLNCEIATETWLSLRKHPFLLAFRRWGRFALRNVMTQRQKFHIGDANQYLRNKSGSHGVPNINFTCLLVDFG